MEGLFHIRKTRDGKKKKKKKQEMGLTSDERTLLSEVKVGSVVSDSSRTHGPYSPWNSPGQNTGVGSLSLLQGIFPLHGWNPGLPHCRGILYS